MNRFTIPIKLTACVFALLCFASIGQASSPPAEQEVHFCLPLTLEDMRARDSLYAARKHALNLNVGEPRTVRMIYFLPNDRPYRAEIVQKMKDEIRNIQTFYRDQMRAHGHGDMTFRFETDAQGEPLVHRVDGQHPDSHYLAYLGDVEIWQAIDKTQNIFFIVIDNSIDGHLISGALGSAARINKNSGVSFVPSGFHWTTAAHELGHTFGLGHDHRDGAYIMSIGGQGRNSLSACAAKLLSVHPYFNPEIPIEDAPPPTIELISSHSYPTGSKSVSIQLKINDPDGLHQVLLSTGGLRTCWELNGEQEATVEFDYDGTRYDVSTSFSNSLVHRLYFEAVDTGGNYGWKSVVLWDAALGVTAFFEEHTDRVTSVAFSPDGTTLASGSWDGTVKLWDIATRTKIATFEGHRRRVFSVAFSPDGTILALGSNPDIKLWDIATRTEIATLEGHWGSASVNAVAFSSDGIILASGSGDETIKLWDVVARTEIARLEVPVRAVSSVAFSPDGSTLASGLTDGTVKLWDVATRTEIATLEGHTMWSVESVAFSPDGMTLASGAQDSTVKLWDVATRTEIATLEGHARAVRSVAFSPDGSTLASGSGDGTIKLWIVESRIENTTLEAAQAVNSVAFLPDGTMLASGSDNGTVLLWDISKWMQPRPRALVKISGDEQEGAPGETLKNPYVIEVKDQYGNPFQGAQVRFTVTEGDGTLTVENATTDANGRAQSLLTLGRQPGVNAVEVSVAELEATFNALGGRTWHLPDGALARLRSRYNIDGIAFSPDSKTLVAGDRLWDVATGQNIPTLKGAEYGVFSGVFSPDGATLVLVNLGYLYLWDVETGQHITLLEVETGQHITTVRRAQARSVAFSPDGSTLASASSGDETIKLWNVLTRESTELFGASVVLSTIATLEGHTEIVEAVAYSPDGTMLASGSGDTTVRLWDVSTRTNIAILEGHTNQVLSIAFSPDGTTLASGADSDVRLWDVAMRKEIAFLRAVHRNEAHSVAFSPDGTTLASGAWEKVKLWDIATRTEIATLEGHTDLVVSVAFSPDGTTLASGSWDGTVLLWDMSPYITPQFLMSDFDGDGAVGFPDFLLFVAQFGLSQTDEGYDARFDLDGDGAIGFGDFLVFANHFGQVVSPPGSSGG